MTFWRSAAMFCGTDGAIELVGFFAPLRDLAIEVAVENLRG